ncbi:MAG: DUF4270 family protein [Flavisolibacter sp.]
MSVYCCCFLHNFSCKKINEATTLGSSLIPAVDNVSTFEVSFDALTKNSLYTDSSKLLYGEPIALGHFTDPEFGTTQADGYFRINSSAYGTYPFLIDKTKPNYLDSLQIDSVVLSLAYAGNYGDTNSRQTVRVFEIDQNSTFTDTANYGFYGPAPTTNNGVELGSKSFVIKDLKDSVGFIRKRDTLKFGNVLRIPLKNSPHFIKRIASFDTTNTSNGGFYSDSIFKILVKGLAVKSDDPPSAGQGGLAYFNLADPNNTKLTVYFRAWKNGIRDTTQFDFYHNTNGQANIIKRTPSGNYASYLSNGLGDKIYLQSTTGSYVSIKVKELDTFSNKVIHRAELVASQITSPFEDVFAPPDRMMLDHINRTHDTAFLFENDLTPSLDGSLAYNVFGGTYQSDRTYRFNITRYVQGIVTRKEPNDSMRLYAPLRTLLFAKNIITAGTPHGSYIAVPVLRRVADGRVVLGGGSYSIPDMRLRLRIIYSNL